ncbi:hypothetical protein PENPOL_c002G10549 [Penicillium polonicum]|uniref:Uncharacterized protein n=1 Tax=Penicillium polonicum TaxID=60169 RepID=A0A1V6NZ86_PENPO|nr:hypothetical protein PENPOL_c002G10549 [Penicillium polonicum]
MSQSTSSPAKRRLKKFLGMKTDGGNDPQDPPSTTKSSNLKRTASTASIDSVIARKVARQSEAQKSASNPKTPIMPASPRSARMHAGHISSNISSIINPDRISILYKTPPKEKVDRYQATGAQFQQWMANTDPAGPACPVVQSTQTLAAVRAEFDVFTSEFAVPPAEILGALDATDLPSNPRSKDYRYSKIHRNGNLAHVPTYEHYIVEGAIIAKAIFRRGQGPQWTDIALALYKHEADINTLRYVYYTTVENKQTQPLVGKVLYPNHSFGGPGTKAGTTIRIWNSHTLRFQQILGTQLGRATARLVLAAWPRGTHQITRINTWFWSGNLHMRFDIEPIARPDPSPRPSLDIDAITTA